MIDLHAHVLPGVDDGARDVAESIAMLRIARAQGTTTIAATPHSHGPDYDVAWVDADEAFAALRDAIARERLDVDVVLAAENWYRPDLPTLAREGRLRGFGATGSRRVLIEFPPTHVPPEAGEVFFQLRLEGVTPVIAHPERNPSFWADPSAAVALREQGALLQVTAGSLTGLFRRESLDCARALAKAGAIDLLASDCHRQDRRPPGLVEARRQLEKWSGRAAAERATEGVPEALLSGAPVPAPQ